MQHFWPYVVLCAILLPLGLFILLFAKKLLLFVKPELLRRNLVTYFAGVCLYLSFAPLFPDFRHIINMYGWVQGLLIYAIVVAFVLLIPYNLALPVIERPRFQKMNFITHQSLILLVLIISSIGITLPINYIFNGNSSRYLAHSALLSFYYSFFGGLVYLFIRHNELEKTKKMMEKELELAKLNELKTRADLEALHSKINPHFLYNSLNSIAHLTLTDGQKAHKMTMALSDLFRYSINYSGSNYCTVKEEIEMVESYLAIEKIRFEDELLCDIEITKDAEDYLLPRFLLQPLVENAVKHGLKAVQQKGHIRILITIEMAALCIYIYDNGDAFSNRLIPGYGLKNVMDKLNLLFPGEYEMSFNNEPQKHLKIVIRKLIKHASEMDSNDN